MNISTYWNKQTALFSIPFLLIASLVLLSQSALFLSNPEILSHAITLDLILTVPFVYFLIIRKKDTPKITIASMFVLGIVIAGLIIPTQNQFVLQQVKTFVFPVVVVFLVFKTHQTRQHFKLQKKNNPDFYTALKISCKAILPERVGALLATEIAVIYYSFFSWKQRDLAANEFSYYKKSGIQLLVSTFIFLIFIETFAMHLMLQLWNHTVAWILTALSLYTCLQFFALIRSMSKRPVFIDVTNRKLFLRYGFFSEATIPFDDIQQIEANTRPLPTDKSILQFSPLGQLDKHNIILHLKSENTLQRIYGMKNQFTSLAIYIDEREQFINNIESVLGKA